MLTQNENLENLLAQACGGEKNAVRSFYELLIISEIVVPLKYNPNTTHGQLADAEIEFKGQQSDSEQETKLGNILTVEFEGKRILPIFTDKSHLYSWAEREIPYQLQKFSSLIWLLGGDIILHLNPGQDCGKEISNWEVQKFKEGPEAISELVEEFISEQNFDFDFIPDSEKILKLRKKVATIVESYPEIDEAFLFELKQDKELPTIFFGLSHQNLSSQSIDSIRAEVETFMEQFSETSGEFIFVDDISDKQGFHYSLFQNAMPFYIKQQALDKNSFVEKLKSLISKS
jgi:SseB protein N-terminal domain